MLPAAPSRAATPKFAFEPLFEGPIFDLTPNHVRMCTCYRDRAGTYHLFTDFIPASAGTFASWGADIRYYRSRNLRDWQFREIAVARGRWRGRTPESDLDWYGAASPNILVSYSTAYLFYAGREHGRGPREPLVTSRLRCRIMLSTAPVDRSGAPTKEFRKQGVVLDKGDDEAWDGLRLDDPCAVRRGDTVHLFFKGLPARGGMETRRIGHATGLVGRQNFFKDAGPVLSVKGGCEMPRAFRWDGQWNLFLRHFEHAGGTWWRHYLSADGREWQLHDPNLFDCAGPEPGRGATDISLVRSFDGALAEPITALATGLENGVLKLWAYRVHPR